MKSIFIMLVALPLISFIGFVDLPIKNATTVKVKIAGYCTQCKNLIENAGHLHRLASVTWDQSTQLASLTFDNKKTNPSVILKRIALAGFDSEEYLAPDNVYALLPACCRYIRINKHEPLKRHDVVETNGPTEKEIPNSKVNSTEDQSIPSDSSPQAMSDHAGQVSNVDTTQKNVETNSQAKAVIVSKENSADKTAVKLKSEPTKSTINEHDGHKAKHDPKVNANPLTPVYDLYFKLKDMLVKTDGPNAAIQAAALSKAIGAINMSVLNNEVHMAWMGVLKELKSDSEQIAKTKDPANQRKYFMALSKNMYSLIKISKAEIPVYYQHCPMANGGKGADWLSKESAIKNPYFGSQMLTCGSTVETIK